MARPKRAPQEIEALKTAILGLDAECNGSNKQIAERLNERGLTNLSGGPWTGVLVGSFKQRHLAIPKAGVSNISTTDLEPDVTVQPSVPSESATSCNRPVRDLPYAPTEPDANIDAEQPDTTYDRPTIEPEPVRVPLEICNIPTRDGSVPSLPDDLVALLTAAHGCGELAALLTWWRSERGGNMATTARPRFVGKRVNSGLLVNEGLKNRAFTKAKAEGMSLSQLVELLFWRYLGEPAEFVAPE